MIPITKPFLPPLEEYNKLLKDIWKRDWLTNMGPLSNILEIKLKEYLGVEHVLFVSNGTTALQMAIKVLDLKGEIITTSYSFIATTSSIVWEGCTPVFVDIDPQSLNVDVTKIEAAISKKTSAILVTHLYGNPCDVISIEKIAKKHNLKIIYDGAHAFGVEINGKSIFNYGHISICSLHATKLYHSIEGGLVISKDSNLIKRLSLMRNFGFGLNDRIIELGINGKNSEFHAAMGLVNLRYIKEIVRKRRAITKRYDRNLKKLGAKKPEWYSFAKNNFAFYPLIFETESLTKKSFKFLQSHGIFARRYFYPSFINKFSIQKDQCSTETNEICSRVLCLPLYYALTFDEVDFISNLLLKFCKEN